ncbi:M4 family metallopeptidase [Kitasatospora sp. NPDC088346]|uniref:M4 family metallopeptidase n=1 Tax=Kitasatospora sp. NPDC088346 TaxID=3364073 RepID=UPI003826E1E1
MKPSFRRAVGAGALVATIAAVLPATGTAAAAAAADTDAITVTANRYGATARASTGSATPRAGALPAASDPSARATLLADARTHRRATAHALNLGPEEELLPKSVTADADGTVHTRYDRTFGGLPVLGGDLVVHAAANGRIMSVDKATDARLAVAPGTVGITAETANGRALESARAAGGQDAKVESVRKVVWAASGEPVLAWESVVGGVQHDRTPSELHVVTDAGTGAHLFDYQAVKSGTGQSQYSGHVTIGTTAAGGTHTMTDDTRGGHRTYDLEHTGDDRATGTLFTDDDDVWGNGRPDQSQTAGVDAAYGAQLTWDYYKDVQGRTGIRNDGVAATSHVHYSTDYANAYWWDVCFCMTYGDGRHDANPLTSIDVAAHEMTHGITSQTAGLLYSNESGALNEATSDIMATAVEFWAGNASDPGDYLIGEKININGDGTPLRYLDQPSRDGESKDAWYPGIGSTDVHWSSGPANHWFYLASEGSGTKLVNGVTYDSPTADGRPVNPIGRDAAARIWYRALSTYMTSTTRYAGARTATLQAAADLYGAESPTYRNAANAWAAVNVGPRTATGVTLVSPGDQVTETGTVVSLRSEATSSNPGALTYTAVGLPAGLTIDASTGLISGIPTVRGTSSVTLTATDPTGAYDTLSFSWTTYAFGQCDTAQLLANPGFESGPVVWSGSGGRTIDSTNPYTLPRTGSWKAFLNGWGERHTDTLSQSVRIPYGCRATLTFWVHVTTSEETTTVPYDTLTVQVGDTVLATYSNLDATTGYVQRSVDLSAYAGRYVSVGFVGREDLSSRTTFLIDDTALTVGN